MSMRERFEAWAKHRGYDAALKPHEIWQAAERAAVRRCAEICEESLSPVSDIRAEFPEHFQE